MTKARSEISVCLSKFWVFKKQLRTALFAPFTLPRYNTPCLPPKAPHPPRQRMFFNFSSVLQSSQEERKNNINAKFWEVRKMEYWQCERGE